jgi:hypothetical protein
MIECDVGEIYLVLRTFMRKSDVRRNGQEPERSENR